MFRWRVFVKSKCGEVNEYFVFADTKVEAVEKSSKYKTSKGEKIVVARSPDQIDIERGFHLRVSGVSQY